MFVIKGHKNKPLLAGCEPNRCHMLLLVTATEALELADVGSNPDSATE